MTKQRNVAANVFAASVNAIRKYHVLGAAYHLSRPTPTASVVMSVFLLGGLAFTPLAHGDLVVDIKPISVGPASTSGPLSDVDVHPLFVGGSSFTGLLSTTVFVERPGTVITLGIYANIMGADEDTTNEGLISLCGGILSSAPVGPPRGVTGTIGNVALAPNYTFTGSHAGLANNLDSTGDLDWGGVSDVVQTGWFFPRAVTSPLPLWNPVGQSTQLLGTFTYTVSDVNVDGSSTILSWIR